ncbi:MAG: peroxidase-related enzyme [Gemmatimonas sp.]
MPHIGLRPDLFGITSLLAYRPETAAALCQLTQVLLRGPSSMTEAERELIATYVSQRNDCAFCAAAHGSAVCHLPGGDAAQVEAVRRDTGSAPLSDKMHALLRLAGKVQQGGRAVSADDAAHARAAGASDVEIHDTVLIAALFCLYNRYVDGLAARTPDDPAYYEALGQRITTRGYSMPPNGYQPLHVNGSH